MHRNLLIRGRASRSGPGGWRRRVQRATEEHHHSTPILGDCMGCLCGLKGWAGATAGAEALLASPLLNAQVVEASASKRSRFSTPRPRVLLADRPHPGTARLDHGSLAGVGLSAAAQGPSRADARNQSLEWSDCSRTGTLNSGEASQPAAFRPRADSASWWPSSLRACAACDSGTRRLPRRRSAD
jgi:hypothetical protein